MFMIHYMYLWSTNFEVFKVSILSCLHYISIKGIQFVIDS